MAPRPSMSRYISEIYLRLGRLLADRGDISLGGALQRGLAVVVEDAVPPAGVWIKLALTEDEPTIKGRLAPRVGESAGP